MNPAFHALCDHILQAGCDRFQAMVGIVSHIAQGDYTVMAVASETGIPLVGDCYALNAVYCREVYEQKRTVAITEIDGVPGMCLHPLYAQIPCEFYISAPILLPEATVWGTLNFTSFEKRLTPFTADDIAYIEAEAARIAALRLPGA